MSEQGKLRIALVALKHIVDDSCESEHVYEPISEEHRQKHLQVLRIAYGNLKAFARCALSLIETEALSPIIIEVKGGIVQDVLNVPEGVEYEIKDYDDMEEAV